MLRYVFKDEPLRLKSGKLADPQKVGEALQAIADQTGGALDPDLVWKAAQTEEHPLHPHFEWDVQKAAESHWRDTACRIIRCVRVVEPDSEAQPPAWVSINAKGGRSYQPIQRVRESIDFQISVLRQAEADLQAFQARYKEFEDICQLVAEAERKLKERLDKRRDKDESRPSPN